MAEAGVDTSSSSARFFCHKCNSETSPSLPDYVCPRCNSGFIEKLESQHDSDSDSSPDMDYEFFELLSDSVAQRRNIPEQSSSSGSPAPGAASSSRPPRRSQRFRHTLNPRHSRRRVNHDRQYALGPILQDIISHMASGVFEANVGEVSIFPGRFDMGGGFPMLLTPNLASNPGDYAWGRGGLDAIISQLMNQLDGTGPPPLPQDKIDQIPVVKITQEQCDMSLQCSVCMDDFRLDDQVRKLNCEHCYHEECILPWLQLHATCPVCRKTLIHEFNMPSSSQTSRTTSNDDSITMDSENSEVIDLTDMFSPVVPEHTRPSTRSGRSNASNNNPITDFMEDELD